MQLSLARTVKVDLEVADLLNGSNFPFIKGNRFPVIQFSYPSIDDVSTRSLYSFVVPHHGGYQGDLHV
jgi:hypothetical protein